MPQFDRSLMSIIKHIQEGKISSCEAAIQIKKAFQDDLTFAEIDYFREKRTGMPEAILCSGKTPKQCAKIAKNMWDRTGQLIATKATADKAEAIKRVVPEAIYYSTSRLVVSREPHQKARYGKVLILAAGTSDIPVAEEALYTLKTTGFQAEAVYDIGVAGLHRLMSKLSLIQSADVLIVVAGMDGALPSVVAGLVSKPVIAVPTNVGYGAVFGGLTPLLTMLNSCAPGVAVMNIDNGFGAAYHAAAILRSINEME